MTKLYPLKLTGVTKSPIWGGTRLLKDWNKSSDRETVGESWELTVRPQDMCRVANGSLTGEPFDALMEKWGAGLTGRQMSVSEFPLLIKLIDAQDALSVQVHPDDSYAARVENDRGKTEMWYIVEADEGAELVCGLAEGMDREGFARAVSEGRISEALHHQPVHAGETYFIPAGLAHAIGRGILIAEIQQNCDLTYRVYDYERRGADGSLRELHVDKALDVTAPFAEDEVNAIRYECGAASEQTLAHCRYFKTDKLDIHGSRTLTVDATSFVFVLCLEGEGSIFYNGEMHSVRRGDGYYLPAGMGDLRLEGNMVLLAAQIG